VRGGEGNNGSDHHEKTARVKKAPLLMIAKGSSTQLPSPALIRPAFPEQAAQRRGFQTQHPQTKHARRI